MTSILRPLWCAALALVAAATMQADFRFEDGDRICYIGSGLADRMQHDGWLETLIQSRLGDQQLVFRNLGFTGDEIDNQPRNKGFTPMESYLALTEADALFVFYGYNESFGGSAKLESFKHRYTKMIDHYLALKPNGSSAPKLVLFSPIAHENLNDKNLPDGTENNARLALYTAAISEIAASRDATFVDLFSATQELYSSSSEPLTINGVHLNEEGNRQVAEVIARELLGKRVSANRSLEQLHEAVLDKNWHWYNRFRATDGNDVWGGRSTLTFVNEQSNAEILKHELKMLDVMTANRDQRIWAVSKGDVEQSVVDDRNVPQPIGVISNVGGGSKSSNAEKEGSTNYQMGDAAISSMKVADGFKVNLYADESRFPELVNPVQMQVDAKGRIWAAAWQTYPKWEPLKEMGDSILIFSDEDNDGSADKMVTFAKVHNPIAFEFWNGGVIVASQPEILFLRDTDGDDVADERIVLLQGTGSADTHHSANNFVYGPDGSIYWQSGIFLRNAFEHPWGAPLSTASSGMYRFDPRRHAISFHAENRPNSHGITFDRWGYHYATDGTSGRTYQVRPEANSFKMHELFKKEVRPVAANEIISSSNFPESMQGNILVCNTIGFLGLKQYALERGPQSGAVWGEPATDLLYSTDKNFRPSDAVFGEDGALYIADWHNVIIGHMQHNIRDPNRDHKHGRIYRMVSTEKPLQKPVKIADASLAQLMRNLEHPIDGVRHRTRVELSALETDKVIAAANKWVGQFDPKSKEDAHHFLEALWVHQQHNVINDDLLNIVLASPEPHARNAAKTVKHLWYTVNTTGGEGLVVVKAAKKMEPELKSGVIADTKSLTEVRIGTIVEKMQYDVKEFVVKAGKKVKLTFFNPDFMNHNLVMVQPGAADEVGMAALSMGAKGFETGYVPVSDKILFASKLLENKEEQVFNFEAPKEPGDYQFVCTFPGHHIMMRGVMKVIK
ncbi:MAG: azurin/sugar lactone lactonase YvrE [Candidatus Pelagisphaera sp.]|jgi:azurin/sugar lactone lactonase YvrE